MDFGGREFGRMLLSTLDRTALKVGTLGELCVFINIVAVCSHILKPHHFSLIGILTVGLLKSQHFLYSTSEIKSFWRDGVCLAECGKRRAF